MGYVDFIHGYGRHDDLRPAHSLDRDRVLAATKAGEQ